MVARPGLVLVTLYACTKGVETRGASLVPRPHPLTRKRGLVSIERFLGCAKSAKCHLSCDLNSATEARVGSGHETTNSSVGRAHGCMTYCYLIGLFSIKTADSAQPKIRSMVTRPLSS